MIEDIVPLIPVHFFSITIEGYSVTKRQLEKRHLLPKLSDFNRERSYCDVFFGWHKEGVVIKVEASRPLEIIELFFDTRDRKTMGYPTRFCHHFYIEVEQQEGSEITRFRTDDAHELCAPELIDVHTAADCVTVRIPKEILFGYEPEQFSRLGFTYRINRGEQNFSICDENFAIEKHPSFWSTIRLLAYEP